MKPFSFNRKRKISMGLKMKKPPVGGRPKEASENAIRQHKQMGGA